MQSNSKHRCQKHSVKRAGITHRVFRLTIASFTAVLLISGCAHKKATVCDLDYCDDIHGISYQRTHNGDIAYPCLDNQTDEAVASSIEPRNLLRRDEDVPRDFALSDAIFTALTHNKVIETSAFGGVGSKGVLTNPTGVSSVYDPAIQSSGVLFGRRSVESALADFDAQFSSRLAFSRSDINLPTASLAGGGNRAVFTSSLGKQFATGGSVTLNHDWYHTVDPMNFAGSTPNYAGRIGAQVRQPLLAGSGVEYTRIAGPANPNFGQITGVSQGVAIARINQDISIADFEISVRNGLRDIENAYWDLYLAYRTYDTAVVAHQSAYQTWREAQDRLEVGVLKPADELQARDRLYETKAQVETNLSVLYKAESELRRLVGMPMNDGTVLRPIDEPAMAEFVPDWHASLTEALTYRTELRRQKWTVKSLQLQLTAARSLVRPRFDLFAGYDVNGAGDTLLSQSDVPFRSAVGSMTNQNIDSWNAGFEFSVPLGYRFSRSQVRNLELQVTRANAVLASQEKNIAHDVATAIQDVTAAYSAAQSNRKRLNAAAKRVELLQAEREIGTTTLDLVLRAQASLAAAEGSYYEQMVAYNKAITALHLAKGTLLENNSVSLAEGQWCPEAYGDALLRAHARTHAKPAPYLNTEPAEFVSPGPAGTVDLHYKQPYPTDIIEGEVIGSPQPLEATPAPMSDDSTEPGAEDPSAKPENPAADPKAPAAPPIPSLPPLVRTAPNSALPPANPDRVVVPALSAGAALERAMGDPGTSRSSFFDPLGRYSATPPKAAATDSSRQ
ncbi:MAG: TolC family protein [Planctomycetaceae bacterium]